MNDEANYWTCLRDTRSSRRQLLTAAGAGAGAGLLLTACAKGSAGGGRSKALAPTLTSQPRSGGNVSVAQSSDPYDWDVSSLGWTTNNGEGVSLAYTPAIRFRSGTDVPYDALSIEPALADTWETPDAQTYTFHLRPGTQFANLAPVNGRALSAADVKWSWEYESRSGEFADKKLPAAANAKMFTGLGGIQTPDAQTVVARFDQPYTPFLNYAAYTWNPVMPHEIYDQYGSFKDHVVGTGAFQLDVSASQKGTRWVWRKNPTYWERGKPYLDQVTWLVVADTPTQAAAFQTKQLDIIAASDPVLRDQIRTQRPDAHLNEYLAPQPIHIYFEVQKPPLNDLRVRKAISLALDRDEWVKTYAPGKGGWALAGAFPDTYSQEEIRGMLKTDIAGAKQLLSAAGYEKGPDLAILTPGQAYGDTYIQQAQLLQSQLSRAGFNASIQAVARTDYPVRKQKHDFQLNFSGKTLAPDIDSYLTIFEPGAPENYGGIDDPLLTTLIHQQRQEADAAKRKGLVRQAAKRINVDQVWALAIFYPTADQIWNPNLQGYGPNFGYQGWPLAQAWLSA